MRIGVEYLREGRCESVVWAPFLKKVELRIVSPVERIIPMEREGEGY